MARLSYDALLLLASLNAQSTMKVTEIAIHVFDGYDPLNPATPNKVAMTRAQRAASAVVQLKLATAFPSRRNIEIIKSLDQTGGAVQAQFLMNVMVRGGSDRRKGERRTEDRPDSDEQRHGDRRSLQPSSAAPARRVLRGYSPSKPKKPSPFDILDRLPTLKAKPVSPFDIVSRPATDEEE